MVTLPAVLFSLTGISCFFAPHISAGCWLAVGVVCLFFLLVSTPKRMFNGQLLQAGFRLPIVIGYMCYSFARAVVSKDPTYHTPHQKDAGL